MNRHQWLLTVAVSLGIIAALLVASTPSTHVLGVGVAGSVALLVWGSGVLAPSARLRWPETVAGALLLALTVLLSTSLFFDDAGRIGVLALTVAALAAFVVVAYRYLSADD